VIDESRPHAEVDMPKSPHELQPSRDVRRAQRLVSRVHGLTTDESAEALRGRAGDCGISVHAAALAVLSASPTDELLLEPSRARPSHPSAADAHHPDEDDR
jgi:hypothetical protein